MTDLTQRTATVDLFTEHLLIGAAGAITSDQRRMAAHDDNWRLAMFHAETDDDVHADHWERHTLGDEIVCCVRGAIRVHLRADRPDGSDEVTQLLPGHAIVVPRDRWHRIQLDEPSDLMVTTIRRGTQRERQAAAPRVP